MSHDGWPSHIGARVLVLGGIRSGKSEFAESLLSNAPSVRYLATAVIGDDEAFAARVAAHRQRRPQSWLTVPTEGDPAMLLGALVEALPEETLLVDDLGGWAAALLAADGAEQRVRELADAVRACRARLVLVSPEVGLSVVPPTEAGVRFADLLGLTNQAVAAACDSVVLVVAGQPSWLRRPGAPDALETPEVPATAGAKVTTASPAEKAAAAVANVPVVSPEVVVPTPAVATPSQALHERTQALPIVATGLVIQPGMDLPIPDSDARDAARDHLNLLDIAGSGLGKLSEVVLFAAGAQSRAVPAPWRTPRLLLLHGDHAGGVTAGQSAARSARIADEARQGEGAIGLLAGEYAVSLQVVGTAAAGPVEFEPATTLDVVEAALRQGWQLADEAADSGVDLLILGSCGAGAEAAAAAIVSAVTGAEVPALLARVVGPDGAVDDTAWMDRCAAVRDALHRVRGRVLPPKEMLAELGGADLAVAAGVILGATARRTPVLVDGPVGVAAGLIARDLGSPSRLWLAMADHGRHPTTVLAADVLGVPPLVDVQPGLGEGTASLLALPLMRSALTLAAALPALPPVLDAPPEHLQEPEATQESEATQEPEATQGPEAAAAVAEVDHPTDEPVTVAQPETEHTDGRPSPVE
ncbi:bifunctional adenosylcobinamide kinase/adenosylcobinamide-phosphate guanylyltransferase [Catellatospora tritici]|uniref:bifunctional adenosylcobinamide kinase/adenosylcobinamide-phosphate guanylyltransferase n=1 Tax=Catellatospora tritici TaxID=2851566 RepID=UPI001C2DEDDA|nr:bifunctional adenosylcobinamide kinase/adenosylcobinamide-phosphate guanylyltransferase [Catellatospora tritici]MBV1852580.1 bifunctional adenosylcobinamide kinase/adenosylcobinamide-phosphate guanylyltransferase [Catellatospora tritici]